jgi:hypothetical protein
MMSALEGLQLIRDNSFQIRAAISREANNLAHFFPDASFRTLAEGRVWKWFAINIPMDLGTGGAFTSDIDVIARLHDFPRSQEWLYKTWEVKVSLLCKDGSALSLQSREIEKNRHAAQSLSGFRFTCRLTNGRLRV